MFRNTTIIWLLALLLCHSLFSQVTDNIDSLKMQLDKPMSDTARVNLLNKIAANVFYQNAEEIEEYADRALQIAKKIDYKKGIAHAYNNLGIFFRTKSIYNEAIDYFFNALAIMESLHDTSGIARSYNLIGIIHYYLGNYDLSLEYYLKALKINKEQGDKKWIAGNSNNIGMIYELKGEYNKALEYYLQSLKMNTELGNENWVANNYGNIGSLYLKMDDPLSLEYFRRRLELKKKLGDLDGISRSNYLIGSYYIKEGDYNKAIPYLVKGYNVALETGSLYDLRKTSGLLSRSYAALNRYKEAFTYHKLFKIYNDSLDLEENTQKITKLQMRNEYQQQQRHIKIEHQKDKLKHNLIALGLFMLVLLTMLLIYRQRLVAKQHKLNQRNLKMDNETLSDELRFKSSLLEDNINYLMNKNEIISSTIEKLNNLKQNADPANHPLINEVVMELKTGLNDDMWSEFNMRFKQIHNDFYSKLNRLFPDLTSNEIKLCAFLKLNLKSKDIAAITKQSIKSIETARTRLRKKLSITNKKVSLSDYINSI